MRGALMDERTLATYEGLNAEYQGIAADFIDFLAVRQSNRDLTLKVIENADKGIDLSEPFDNIDDLMVALDA